MFPRQSLEIFTFRVKLSDSIFFLLGHSPIVKLIKVHIFRPFTWKILFNSLRTCKET